MVRVLIFVNQNVAKLLLVNGGDIWKRSEQVNGFADQVVEVESVVAAKLALVLREEFCDSASLRITCVNVSRESLGVVEFVFCVRDCRGNGRRS